MKHIKTYEALMGDIARLNPKRNENDDKALILFDEIFEDYARYGNNLKKVSILDDNDRKVSFSKIEIGKYYRLTYVFGKFHPVDNNTNRGNDRSGNRKIIITDIPFSLTIKKDSLERAFNTSRIKLRQTTIKDISISNNLRYNPNSDSNDPEIRRRFNTKEDEYKISYDVSEQVFKFFIEEFKHQYPDLSKSRYKNSDSISEIERGISPIIKYITVKNKYGKDLPSYRIRKGDDEKELRKKLYNMTEDEFIIFRGERNKEIYKKDDEMGKKIKDEWEIKMDSYFKKHGIDLSGYVTEWAKYGFRLMILDHEINVDFRTVDKDISNKIQEVFKEDFGKFNIKSDDVREGYSYDKDGLIFVRLSFKNEIYS